MHPDQLDGELMLAPGFPTPPNTDYQVQVDCTMKLLLNLPAQGYHQYITQNLPPESPHLYGLHPNAEIGFLTSTSEKLFKTVFELQVLFLHSPTSTQACLLTIVMSTAAGVRGRGRSG